ncbi:hypothetical protein BKA82DRAFT_4018751 [Pisolithus tinctorius]|nr:hypothetical protein BKA82DRAFT_4018751 [Pisolithus tinctorius]
MCAMVVNGEPQKMSSVHVGFMLGQCHDSVPKGLIDTINENHQRLQTPKSAKPSTLVDNCAKWSGREQMQGYHEKYSSQSMPTLICQGQIPWFHVWMSVDENSGRVRGVSGCQMYGYRGSGDLHADGGKGEQRDHSGALLTG